MTAPVRNQTRSALTTSYELQILIEAEPAKVWQALTEDTNAWWLPDFHMVGEGSVVTLDARAGGQLLEAREDGSSLLWCTVHMCKPGETLYMIGYIAPDWGGPATSMLKLGLEETAEGTLLRVQDSHHGHVDDKNVQSLMDGWTQLFTEGLKRHVEKT